MATVICNNLKCEFISKRRSKFNDYKKEEILCHTCRKKVLSIRELCGGDSLEEERYGYIPMECCNNTER